MNDQWLNTFIVSAECGSFSKAANALYISTPSLVQQINLFEKELGFTVFNRSRKGISLTPAGRIFLQTAKELRQVYKDGLDAAASVAAEKNLTIKFGFAPYQFPEQWITLLNEFQELNESVSVRLIPTAMNEQIAAIYEHQIDLCLIAKPGDSFIRNLCYIDLMEDTYSFCMNAKHPLAHKTSLTMNDLQDQTVVYGEYPYMEQSFRDGLRGVAKLRCIPTEYNLRARFEFRPEELFVVHSSWSEPFFMLHRVVPSDISAGHIGFVCRPEIRGITEQICMYFSDNVK
ncbi:MAG: LysR family transcriptional regulator [Chordicoccus sp.]